MTGVVYIQVALTFVSVMLAIIFYISWRTFGRGLHSLAWSCTFSVAAVQWILNIAHNTGFALTDQLTYWMIVSGLAYLTASLGLVGYLLRAGKEINLKLFLYAILGAEALTLWASLPGGHWGISIGLSPLFTACTTAGAAWVLLSAEKKNGAEWGAIVVNVLFCLSQLAAGGISLSMGAAYDAEISAVFVQLIFLTLPTAFTGAGLFMVTVLAADLAARVQALSEKERERLNSKADHYWDTLEEAIAGIPDLVAIDDGTGRTAACNEPFAALLGLEKKDLIGRSIMQTLTTYAHLFERVDDQEVRENSDVVGNALYRSLKENAQVLIRMKNGQVYAVDCAPVKTGGNILFARNVTEIQEAKIQLEEAISSMPLAFALFDPANNLVACNRGIERLMDRDRNWITSQTLETVLYDLLNRLRSVNGVAADARDGWHEAGILEALSSGAASFLGEMADGSWHQISSRRMESGGFVIIAHDVTQRRQLEMSLERNEAQLRGVLKGQPFPVVIIRNSDASVLFASSAAEEALKVERNGLIGVNFSRFTPDDTRYVFAGGREEHTGLRETDFRRASGEPFPVLCSGQTLLFQGAEATVLSFIDLSDQVRLEDELKSQREALFQSEKLNALGTLLAGVAHELNNPLTVVVANAHVLSLKGDDPELKARANKITEAAERCSGIVRSFLAMARKGQSERCAFDMKRCIENALNISNYGMKQEGISIDIDIEDDLPTMVGDADQLSQVILNLLLNSQQALSGQAETKHIRLSCRYDKSDNLMILDVSDNGPGVPADIRAKIFDPFFTTKQVGSGTGLGLFLVRGTVKSHGGRIELLDHDAPGATFRISLPVKSAPDLTDTTAQSQGIKETTSGQRILIVDDEPDILEILNDILEHCGHSVFSASSGQAALDTLQQQTVDLVISDLRMPGMSGEVLFDRLCKEYPSLEDHVAFMTGDNLSDDVHRFLNSCARPVLNKPFAPQDVRDLLAKMRVAS